MSDSVPQKTCLHEWHRTHEARLVEFGGWEMPLHYASGILAEHLAARRFGALFDVSHMGRFGVSGPGSIPFLQHVLSNNAETLQPWGPHAQYTFISDEDGGVLDDAYLYRLGESDYRLVVNAANAPEDWRHLQQQVAHFPDVAMVDQTGTLAMFAAQGPVVGSVLAGLIEHGALPEPLRNRTSEAAITGADVFIARTGYTGEPIGFELMMDAGAAPAVWEALVAAGAEAGVVPAGLGARDTLRLEAALPLHGHELGPDPDGRPMPAFASPLAPLAVSFSARKGDFIGRAALARQFVEAQRFLRGVGALSDVLSHQVRPLGLLDRGVARRGDAVFLGDRQVGVVTSGTMAPYWEVTGQGATMTISDTSQRRSIALAYVEATLPPEQDVEVAIRGKRVQGRLVRWHGRSEAPPYFRAIPAEWHKPLPAPVSGAGLSRVTELLRRSVDNHVHRQRRCMNLIPSEMTPSPLVRLLEVSDPSGRYAEHKEVQAAFRQEVYFYQGTDFIAWVEDRLLAELRAFLGCSLVEARPISGQMANLAVFSALVDYRNLTDRRREPERLPMVLNHHLGKGGHLSSQPMGALRDCLATSPLTERAAVVDLPVCADNPYRTDVAATAELVEQLEPELIVLGKSLVLHPEPIAEIRAAISHRASRPLIMYDMAHVLGLLGPHFQEPFCEGVDLVTASTHKTFFGTQRGIIAADLCENTPEYELWEAILRRTFPGGVSNHHLGTLVGLLLAAIEMNTFRDEYQRQVIANAKAFARALKAEGVDVQGDPAVGFTETHQVALRVGAARGCGVAAQLEASNIIANYQALPGDEGFTASSGLRLGVAEMTRFGMNEADFERFAPLMVAAIRGDRCLADEVAAFRADFQTMRYCFRAQELQPAGEELLGALF